MTAAEDLPLLETRMTFLEMVNPPPLAYTGERKDVLLERKDQPDVDEYVALFRAIGQHWLWQNRLAHTRDEIAEIISRAETGLYILYTRDEHKPVGILELDWSDAVNVNLVYFGLVSEYIGQQLGGFLMQNALRIVWERMPRPERFWFTTCTFDHPGALGFYKHFGFRAYRTDVPDSFPDPRLNPHLYGGAYAVTCAPHVPLARRCRT
jgi:GNAT superfamily N-acetyltransferase